MKIFITIMNFLLFLIGLICVTFVATFFLSIFMRENVVLAIEFFRELFKSS